MITAEEARKKGDQVPVLENMVAAIDARVSDAANDGRYITMIVWDTRLSIEQRQEVVNMFKLEWRG